MTHYRKTESAGGIVLNPAGEIVMVEKLGKGWSFPKGKPFPGEPLLDAAKREIYEESGITTLSFIQDLGSYCRTKVSMKNGVLTTKEKCITLFLFQTNQVVLKPIDPQHPSAKWIPLDQVSSYLEHPKDKEFFTEILPLI